MTQWPVVDVRRVAAGIRITALQLWLVCLTGLLGPSSSLAQPARSAQVIQLQLPGLPAQRLYGESHALVIGASNYRGGWSSLPGVPGDVVAVARLLRDQGFTTVKELNDPSYAELDVSLREFVTERGGRADARLLVYFAGHGHTLTTAAGNKIGYIVPVDAPQPDQPRFRALAYSMEAVEALARQTEAKHVLFMFDSCFSGTIFRTRQGVPDSIGLRTAQPVRMFITAGDENQKVPDVSVFRRQFEEGLGQGAADLNGDGYITGSELGMFLEDRVTNYTRRSQTPRYGKIQDPNLDKGDVVFVNRQGSGPQAAVVAPSQTQQTTPSRNPPESEASEARAWTSCQSGHNKESCKAYLSAWPQGRYAALAQDRIHALELSATPAATSQLRVSKDCADCPEMVVLPAGSFVMGSPGGEPGRTGYEGPQRRVTFARPFAIGRTEVTQGQWRAVMGSSPSKFGDCGAECPVERVSWDDSQEYIKKLSKMTGQTYRLPTEAEWEYAARAGTSTPFSTGQTIATDQANFDGNYTYNGSAKGEFRLGPVKVASFAPNSWGLHDVHGNVAEWVQDCGGHYDHAPSDGTALAGGKLCARVIRGGGWSDGPIGLRIASRGPLRSDSRSHSLGFRVARDVR